MLSKNPQSRGLLTRFPRPVLRALLLGALFSGRSQAGSDVTAEKDLLDLPLEELVQVEIADVYGASKRTQKTTQAPSSVTVVTAREIKIFGHKTLGDILSSVRGFYISKNRYYEFLGVRGFNRPQDFNSRVLVLIDGLRTNEMTYGGSFMDGALPIDVDLIERVEVIRGPGSSLYGTGAFFAVINIIPKRGQALNGVDASAEYGSWGSVRGRLSAGKKSESGLEGLVSVSGYNTHGPKQVVFPELAGDPTYNNGVVENNHAVHWRNAFASLEYGDFRFSYAESGRYNDYAAGLYGNIFNTPSLNYDSVQLLDLQFNHALGANDGISARIAHNRYDYYSKSLYDYPPVTLNYDYAKYNALIGEITYKTLIAGKHRGRWAPNT
ncbi:MAG: hypothetical protein EXR36_09530 [Betaproteobacteria bacterium]|nr:hypothetical protein [Betaproteobacteria bacterium]